jgi:hypothetical protein
LLNKYASGADAATIARKLLISRANAARAVRQLNGFGGESRQHNANKFIKSLGDTIFQTNPTALKI